MNKIISFGERVRQMREDYPLAQSRQPLESGGRSRLRRSDFSADYVAQALGIDPDIEFLTEHFNPEMQIHMKKVWMVDWFDPGMKGKGNYFDDMKEYPWGIEIIKKFGNKFSYFSVHYDFDNQLAPALHIIQHREGESLCNVHNIYRTYDAYLGTCDYQQVYCENAPTFWSRFRPSDHSSYFLTSPVFMTQMLTILRKKVK